MCPIQYEDFFPNGYLLLCPSLHQIKYLRHYPGNIDNFFKNTKNRNEIWLWHTFAKPVSDAQRVQHFHPNARRDGRLSLLEQLPSELIEDIIDALLNDKTFLWVGMESVVTFGLSSPRLWPIVLRRIHREYAKNISPWAGEKVGFHGSCSGFTSAQTEEYGIGEPALIHKQIRDWLWTATTSQPDFKWRERIRALKDRLSTYTDQERDKIEEDMSQAYLYPQDRVWVLRNLTTKQIVRSDRLQPPPYTAPQEAQALEEMVTHLFPIRSWWKGITNLASKAKCKETSKPAKPEPLTLTQIFLVLTCYSNATYPARYQVRSLYQQPESKFKFQHGPWCTHAFDIVTLEHHLSELAECCPETEREKEEKPWIDVTDAAVADVGHLRWCVRQWNVLSGESKNWQDQGFWDMVATTRVEHRRWANAGVVVGEGEGAV